MTGQVGRPSLYRPEYCREVVETMATGVSLTAAMSDLGFSRQQAHIWAASHPEFFDAIALGHAKRSAFLERKGLACESGPQMTFITKALPNCNPDDFREKVETENKHIHQFAGMKERLADKIARVVDAGTEGEAG